MPPAKINLAAALDEFTERWHPHTIAQVSGHHIKLAKLLGEFVWHHHEHEDEMFLVLKGKLVMKFRDRDVELREGEMIVVPAGVEHLPVAIDEVHILLVEPASTINTGNIRNERTILPTYA